MRLRSLLVAAASLAAAAPAASAPTTITITTTQREVRGLDAFQVSGGVGSGRAGEDVTVEVKECGSYAPFHEAGGAQSGAGGTWATQIGLTGDAQLRARWRGGVSEPIAVKVHPYMTLTYRGPGRYLVWIRANDYFGGARAVLQRLSGNRWLAVKTFALKRAPSGGVASTTGVVRAKVKKGWLLRAVLPQKQAGRCYLAGFTDPVKV